MTPQLQQAIKLLQLTNLELKQYLEEQTFDNPFVNVEEEKSTTENKKTEETPTKLEDSNSCLLYTSPSPRDRSLSRMPSSA